MVVYLNIIYSISSKYGIAYILKYFSYQTQSCMNDRLYLLFIALSVLFIRYDRFETRGSTSALLSSSHSIVLVPVSFCRCVASVEDESELVDIEFIRCLERTNPIFQTKTHLYLVHDLYLYFVF